VFAEETPEPKLHGCDVAVRWEATPKGSTTQRRFYLVSQTSGERIDMVKLCGGALAKFPEGLTAQLLVNIYGIKISLREEAKAKGPWPRWFLNRYQAEGRRYMFESAIRAVKARGKLLEDPSATTDDVQTDPETFQDQVRPTTFSPRYHLCSPSHAPSLFCGRP
jgi:hypothetical protein